MKKFTMSALSLAMAFSLAACGNDVNEPDPENGDRNDMTDSTDNVQENNNDW